jgi:pyruvate/2-oxoglutarate dehydrogenase complex dihydrolipoamide acyltransferase (E2) component
MASILSALLNIVLIVGILGFVFILMLTRQGKHVRPPKRHGGILGIVFALIGTVIKGAEEAAKFVAKNVSKAAKETAKAITGTAEAAISGVTDVGGDVVGGVNTGVTATAQAARDAAAATAKAEAIAAHQAAEAAQATADAAAAAANAAQAAAQQATGAAQDAANAVASNAVAAANKAYADAQAAAAAAAAAAKAAAEAAARAAAAAAARAAHCAAHPCDCVWCPPNPFCFAPGTPVVMSDGTTMSIEDIKIGMETATGTVRGVMQFDATNSELYDYNGIKVTGIHKVMEGGKFTHVATSKLAKKIGRMTSGTLYDLDTSSHRIRIGDTIFADFSEADWVPDAEQAYIDVLNGVAVK